MAIRNTLPLRAPEEDLSSSRQQFIQTLEDKKLFTQECAAIIPELDRLWKEKILSILGYGSMPGEIGYLRVEETHAINWKHYLFSYSPQLLSKAITKLASRLKLSTDSGPGYVLGSITPRLVNARGPVNNVAAYYKKLVQDLRRQEIRRQEKEGRLRLSGQATDHIWLMEDKPGKIGIRLDCGDSGVVYVTPRQAGDLAQQLLSFLPKVDLGRYAGEAEPKVECPACFEESGSYNCIRPAHTADLCPDCGLPPANDPMLPTGTHICRNSAPRRTQQ